MVTIDNVDALKTWLVKKLSPVSDADPNALAKYVVALVKKDKSKEDLKALCHEQLDVFLQKETEGFVTNLFESLNTKSYLESVPESTANNELPKEANVEANKNLKKEEKPLEYRSRSRSPNRVRTRISPETRRRNYEERRSRRRGSPDNRRHNRRERSRSISPRRRQRPSSPYRKRGYGRQTSPRKSRSPKPLRSNSLSPSRANRSQSPEVKRLPAKKERCWDYDQKGFCMKGDLCPYDHGNDAVVVDDLTITSAPDKEEKKAEKPKFEAIPVQPPQMILPPLGMQMPLPPQNLQMMPPPHFMHQRFPIMNMNVPPPPFPPPRLTTTPYNPEAPALNLNQANNQKPMGGFNDRKRSANGNSQEPAVKKPYNNYNTNKTLIVKKIPAHLNNITKLNEHFAKFGAINNIQVKFDTQSDQALVEFAHINSARSAIRDTDAVLNNRFIRVFWFNTNDNPQQNAGTDNQATVKDRMAKLPTPDQMKYTAPGVEKKDGVNFTSGTISRTISNSEPTEEGEEKKPETAAQLEAKKLALQADNEAMKKLIEIKKAARVKAIQKQKMVLQKKIELHKQRDGLIQKQIEQQKVLLAKLDSDKNMSAKDRHQLISTLKVLATSIDKVQTLQRTDNKLNFNQEKQKQAQKDLLDTEMDLFNASANGENTNSLRKRLSQLKAEANTLGLVTAYRGGWRGRGVRRGRGRGRGRGNRFIQAGANLDRRPCELRISGFHSDEKDEVVAHFSEFGEISSFLFDDEGITCTLKFKGRHEAEQAASQGVSFKNRNLIIVWSSQPNKIIGVIPPPPPTLVSHGSPILSSPTHLLASDKEEDQDDDDDISVTVEPVAPYTPPEEEDEFGYGLLEEELDEEALLTGADVEDDVEDV